MCAAPDAGRDGMGCGNVLSEDSESSRSSPISLHIAVHLS